MKKIRLATRGSPLALIQAQMTADYLRGKIPGAEFEVIEVKTRGDKNQALSLSADGGTGLFTKEIENALLEGAADIAVHSAKDMPTEIAPGLRIAGCLPRDAYRDVLVLRDGVEVPSLIASSSPRRRAQLKKLFPNVVWSELRGNVHTRLSKITSGLADATVLSEAGLSRLGLDHFDGVVFKPLKIDICVPAAGQGIIAYECREDDFEMFGKFSDDGAMRALSVERAFLRGLGAGCQTACAAYFDGSSLRIFHEDCGFKKIDVRPDAPTEELLDIAAAAAANIRR